MQVIQNLEAKLSGISGIGKWLHIYWSFVTYNIKSGLFHFFFTFFVFRGYGFDYLVISTLTASFAQLTELSKQPRLFSTSFEWDLLERRANVNSSKLTNDSSSR